MKELWGIANIKGICKHCGKTNTREVKVNRGGIDWGNSVVGEPIAFGYMGDCLSCGGIMGGAVNWSVLIVTDEVEI